MKAFNRFGNCFNVFRFSSEFFLLPTTKMSINVDLEMCFLGIAGAKSFNEKFDRIRNMFQTQLLNSLLGYENNINSLTEVYAIRRIICKMCCLTH